MDLQKSIVAFVEVANQQSFSKAAAKLNMPTSTLSRAVSDLEEWAGHKLLIRSTRSTQLSAKGREILSKCQDIIEDVAALQDEKLNREVGVSGELRVTAPVFLGKRLIGPLVKEFLETFPDLQLSIHLQDQFIDLHQEGFDVAVRVSREKEISYPEFVVQRLFDMHLRVIAAPEYLQQYGAPNNAAELGNHNCIVGVLSQYKDRWPLDKAGVKRHKVHGNLKSNTGELILDMVLDGVGIGILPDFFVQDDINRGRLVPLLENRTNTSKGFYWGAVYVLYPRRLETSKKITAFADYLIANVQQK